MTDQTKSGGVWPQDQRDIEARERLSIVGTDWAWCYENPREAAAEIDQLNSDLKRYRLLFETLHVLYGRKPSIEDLNTAIVAAISKEKS